MAGFADKTIIYTTNKIYTTKIGGTIQNPLLAITSISESVSKERILDLLFVAWAISFPVCQCLVDSASSHETTDAQH